MYLSGRGLNDRGLFLFTDRNFFRATAVARSSLRAVCFVIELGKMGPALRHKASGVWNWMHIDTETWDGCEQWVLAAFPTFSRD